MSKTSSGASSVSVSGSDSSASSSWASIPSNVRKTIQHIKEINNNHSDEDIYAMLQECSMDPNETSQRLLHLDTFHEVKRKRDKKKEAVKSRSVEESRWKHGHQGRGTRNARGNSFPHNTSNDAGSQRIAAIRKENGVQESRGKGFGNSVSSISKETDSIHTRNLEKSASTIMEGPLELPNGSLSGDCGLQSFRVGQTYPSNKKIGASANSAGSLVPKACAENAFSTSDPVLVAPCDMWVTRVGSIKQEGQVQHLSAESSTLIPADRGLDTTESISNNHLNRHEPQSVDRSRVSSSISEKKLFKLVEIAHPKKSDECSIAEMIHVSDGVTVVDPFSPPCIELLGGANDATTKPENLNFSVGQHVIIPQHIQVPDAVKSVLSFGSLDASFGIKENCVVGRESHENFNNIIDSAHEPVSKLSPCDQAAVSTAPQETYADHSQLPPHLPGKNSSIDAEVSSAATAPQNDQPKQETLPAVGPPFPVVQPAPSYSFGFMPSLLANVLVSPEGIESQARVSNSLGGSSVAMSTSASTPPPIQSGAGQISAVSPRPIPLFHPPYPSSYLPFSPYFSPFYVPPTMHQYYGHTAFPPPLPTDNMYLSPLTAAAGMKLSLANLKPGTNSGNQVPVGVPSGYVAHSLDAVAAVISGHSSNGEDLSPPPPKENSIFPGQQSEGSTVWFHAAAAARDSTSFLFNPYLNLPQQGHVLNPQTGHGGYAVYHTPQPMGSPAPGLPLLHQSQPVVGSVESVGPPPNSYQQPQCQQQINWNM